jgi:serine/threonine-protein kinase
MTDDERVQELLDQLLDSNATPEQVCESYPELLPVVRERWQQLQRLRSNLDAMFPPSDDSPTPLPNDAALPQIPGYEIEAILGRGGVGIVFRAKHLGLNRLVALKMLLTGAYAGRREKERFQREALAVAALRHPNVVQIHDVGEHEGRPYFTMELVEGGSLARALAGTPQPARKAAETVVTLASAVGAAHASGIVHRDLKPANILLTAPLTAGGQPSWGTPKITDFGLARRLNDGARLTQTGVVVGTPSYMAPEQARGQPDAIGSAVDVYALGAILYEMLTGRPPFRAATAAETVQQVISQEPAAPSRLNNQVPRDLETICLKCLHKEPQRRYASAAALADDLKRFLDGRPIQARPVGWIERLWRWIRRNPLAAALVTAALALVGLASGGGVWFAQQRVQRDRELHSEVTTAVNQAASLRKGFHFDEARELLEQARQRLEPAGPDDLRRLVKLARSELDLAERLDTIQLRGAQPKSGRYDPSWVEPQYVSVFAESGLGRVGDDSEVVAARVRESGVREEIVAALDDWANVTPDRDRRDWLLKVTRAADPARDRLRQSGLWDNPELWKDQERAKQLTEELRVAEFSPQLATTLCRIGQASGGDGVKLLTVAQARFPQDFWLNFDLGVTLWYARRLDEALGYFRATVALRPKVSTTHTAVGGVLRDMGRVDESIGYFEEALRLDPKNVLARATLAGVLQTRGRLDEAIDQFQRAVQLDPKYSLALASLGPSLYATARAALRDAAGQGPQKKPLGEPERAELRRQALARLRVGLDLKTKLFNDGKAVDWPIADWQTDPVLASVRDPAELAKLPDAERQQWQRLWADVAALVAADPLEQGRAFAARRDWAKAADCYEQVLKRGLKEDGHFWFEYAALLVLSGDRAGYSGACAYMMETCGKSGGPRAYHVARACTLAPDAVAEPARPGRLAEAELQRAAKQFWSLTEQGALAYRAGRFQEAVPLFEESLKADDKSGRAVVNWLWLALANQRLGKSEEARRWLVKAQAFLELYRDGMPVRADAEVGLHFHNWLEAHVLRREAEALIPTTKP